MALNLYRRHAQNGTCQGGHAADSQTYETDEKRPRWKHCHCWIYASGQLPGKPKFRKNTKRIHCSEAREVADAWERGETEAPKAETPAGDLILAPRIAPPPPFGKTPTDISQIIYAAGAQATRTAAPIVSAPIGMGQVPGLALLALPLYIDYSMGNFSLPMQFPSQCMLLWAATLVYASFAGSAGPTDTTFQLGTASGRNDILTADGMGPIHTTAIHPVEGTLPFAADPNPGQCWLTVNNQGNTSGSGVITLIYFRTASNWN